MPLIRDAISMSGTAREAEVIRERESAISSVYFLLPQSNQWQIRKWSPYRSHLHEISACLWIALVESLSVHAQVLLSPPQAAR